MAHEFVMRLLDADDTLLSWVKVLAQPKRADGKDASCPLWPTHPVQFVIERDGTAVKYSVHWLDLDIARVRDLPDPIRVSVGQAYNYWFEPVWLVSGMKDVPLPAVTVRQNVCLAPPTAQIGARDPRVA
jgi:hypothetical protein